MLSVFVDTNMPYPFVIDVIFAVRKLLIASESCCGIKFYPLDHYLFRVIQMLKIYNCMRLLKENMEVIDT